MSELPVVPSSDGTPLKDIGVEFEENHSETKPQLIIKRSQDIPDDHIAELKRAKIDPDHKPTGDLLHFARIPTIFVEEMIRDGIDFNRATVKEICTWLHRRGLDSFIVTSKRLY